MQKRPSILERFTQLEKTSSYKSIVPCRARSPHVKRQKWPLGSEGQLFLFIPYRLHLMPFKEYLIPKLIR